MEGYFLRSYSNHNPSVIFTLQYRHRYIVRTINPSHAAGLDTTQVVNALKGTLNEYPLRPGKVVGN